MATVTVLQETTGVTYTINVNLNQSVDNGVYSGARGYFISVGTVQRDFAGHAIPAETLKTFAPTAKFNVAINASIIDIMEQTAGTVSSSSLSSSSRSSLSSVSSINSASSTSSNH